jgi:ubiquinone/menaquinone biosynthesis C-methylase UbiE
MSNFAREIYDKERAEKFERYFVATRWAQYKLDLLAELVSHHFNMHGDQTILEVGCGPGGLAPRLAKILGTNRVTCLDVSRAMIDICRARAHDAEQNIEFIVGDALDLPFKSATFDIVIERNISPLLHEQSWNDGIAMRVLSEMKRCSSCLLVVMHQNKAITTLKYQYKRYTKNEFTGRLEEIGLHRIKCIYATHSTPQLLRFLGERGMKSMERLMTSIPFVAALGGSIIAGGYI